MKQTILSLLTISMILFAGCNGGSDIQANLFAENDCENPGAIVDLGQKDKEIVILDVRTPEEYNEGHLSNAMNVDFRSTDFEEQIENLDKNKSYFVYCRSGNRSGQALEVMEQKGFQKICHMDGGINKWKAENNHVCTGSLTC